MKEITSTSSLGISNPTSPMRVGRSKWKDYIKRAVLLLKNNKMAVNNTSIITLAAALRSRDK